jgi:hypothetical protein
MEAEFICKFQNYSHQSDVALELRTRVEVESPICYLVFKTTVFADPNLPILHLKPVCRDLDRRNTLLAPRSGQIANLKNEDVGTLTGSQ